MSTLVGVSLRRAGSGQQPFLQEELAEVEGAVEGVVLVELVALLLEGEELEVRGPHLVGHVLALLVDDLVGPVGAGERQGPPLRARVALVHFGLAEHAST